MLHRMSRFYLFSERKLETYEKYLQPKKDCPFTAVGDLETKTRYISEIGRLCACDFSLFHVQFSP